jgi:hypothetical protein
MDNRFGYLEAFINWLHRITFCKWGYHNMLPVYMDDPINSPWICQHCSHVVM